MFENSGSHNFFRWGNKTCKKCSTRAVQSGMALGTAWISVVMEVGHETIHDPRSEDSLQK